jgi:hypothetical protein
MENRAIADLQAKALEYAAARDQRMELTTKETKLKEELMDLMKKHRKDSYQCEGIEISIVHGEDTVKVKVHKADEEKDAA